MRAQAVKPLATFLDYITFVVTIYFQWEPNRCMTIRYSYMIDNVVLLITGTLHERDTSELMYKCHPLGVFDAMGSLCVATNVSELYNSVLVDTPLGKSFAFDSRLRC